MKKLMLLPIFALSLSTFAIEFITEEQVAQKLGALKAIEVSKYSVEPIIEKSGNSQCQGAYRSRSSRAYVVRNDQGAFLYLTPSGLNGLAVCIQL